MAHATMAQNAGHSEAQPKLKVAKLSHDEFCDYIIFLSAQLPKYHVGLHLHTQGKRKTHKRQVFWLVPLASRLPGHDVVDLQ